jgi:cysteinyl-tRNA synthetase
MGLRLYNTLTRSVEPFRPLAPPAVTVYVCGPTVYDEPHIGHARSAYVFDVLRRSLAAQSFGGKPAQVRFVRNVTDVDDKIIDKARQELGPRARQAAPGPQRAGPDAVRAKCHEVAERYLTSYHAAMDRLGIRRPDVEPRATEHVVPEMTDFISKLLIQGVAYESQGDVYFSVRKFPGYGALSNRALDALEAGARVEPGEHKHDPLDFALWKAAKPDEPSWQSPWGSGRPGWHIECSAMSTKELGDAFDIHGGGVDLVFPHHENEIAQAQAAGKPFARTWVHNGLLTVNGEKMSKSLGNFVTIEQAMTECGGEPDVLKAFFLSAHYRSPVDYSPVNLRAAEGRYRRLLHFCHAAMNQPAKATGRDVPAVVAELEGEFRRSMDDDLNTPRALAALDQLAGVGYQRRLDERHVVARVVVQLAREAFGLVNEFLPVELSPEEVGQLHEREAARRRRDYARADEIRQRFRSRGLAIEDTSNGPVVLRSR